MEIVGKVLTTVAAIIASISVMAFGFLAISTGVDGDAILAVPFGSMAVLSLLALFMFIGILRRGFGADTENKYTYHLGWKGNLIWTLVLVVIAGVTVYTSGK